MTKNANFVSHKKSKLKNQDGTPQLPLASALVEGEIAINFAENVETLSIKNESGDVVTFSSDNYYTEKKLGSGFTGANSAVTVTEALENVEIDVDQVLDDTTSASTNAIATQAVYGPIADLSGQSETVAAALVELNSEHETIAAALVDLNSEHETIAYSLVDLNNRVLEISGNTSNYYTKDETSGASEIQEALDEKADISDIPSVDGYADSVKYNSETHYVEFYHGTTAGTKVFEYDASPFIIDGMVQNVEIKDVTSGGSEVTCLVISFNTDAGKQDINVPISDIFDASNYYDKTAIDALVGSGFTSSSITDVIIENEEIVSAALTDLDERKLDASAYTPIDLSNYDTKDEVNAKIESATSGKVDTSAFNTYSAATKTVIDSKLDASAYTPTDLSNYYTKSETSGATELKTAFNGKTDTATTTALNNVVTAHTENATIHVTQEDKNKWNNAGGGFVELKNPSAETKVGLVNKLSQYYDTNIGKGAVIEGDGYDINRKIIASGEYSHTEGYFTIASGHYSHAEGRSTTASGQSSHAEGNSAQANGESSHAEGNSAQANGESSHAEGYGTKANGSFSHAEGSSTTAKGNYSHAEGLSTTASGQSSHAEGYLTIASGYTSHAEGNSAQANGESSHAEGYGTKANGSFSHAEGYVTTASGNYSHAEGSSTTAKGNYSHAEGFYTVANNKSEHASGQYNASYSASTEFGDSGNTLFSVGNGTANDARHNVFEIRQNGDIYITSGNSDIKLQDYIGSVETVTAITPSNSGSTEPIATKVVAENKLTVSNALNDLNTAITAHTADTSIHVTAADKQKINSLTGSVGTMAYEDKTSYSSATDVNTALNGKANTATTISAGDGLSGGGDLSTNITISLEMPTTYSAETYTSSTITSSEPIVYALVSYSGTTSLDNQVCPVSGLVDGQQCNVIYYSANNNAYNAVISTSYVEPDGQGITLKIPAGGYAEINYINIKGIIFVRGI